MCSKQQNEQKEKAETSSRQEQQDNDPLGQSLGIFMRLNHSHCSLSPVNLFVRQYLLPTWWRKLLRKLTCTFPNQKIYFGETNKGRRNHYPGPNHMDIRPLQLIMDRCEQSNKKQFGLCFALFFCCRSLSSLHRNHWITVLSATISLCSFRCVGIRFLPL